MIDAAIRRLAASSAYELHKPLALAEYPYQHLPVGGFKAYLDVLMQFPELSGPLSKAARKALLLTTQKHREINIIEVHVDLSHIDDELAVVLMTLGFEPDDFFSLHPECYKRHLKP